MANTHSVSLVAASTQWAKITDAAQTGLDLSTAFTLELWVKPTSVPSNSIYYFLLKAVSFPTDAAFQFYYDTQGGGTALILTVCDGSNSEAKQVTQALTTGTWQHIAVTWEGSGKSFKFYYNGTQVSTTQTGTTVASLQNNGNDFAIAAKAGNNPFDGLMDDIRVWNVVRTQSEINNNKSVELAGNESGLVAYWKMNNNLNDSTSNGNNLTGQNSPTFSTDHAFGAAYTQTLNEAVALVATMSNGAGKVLGETVTLVQTMSKDVSKTFGEVVTLVATSTASLLFTRSFDEALALVDSAAARISGKTLNEVVTLVDSISRVVNYLLALSETVTLVASSAIVRQYARSYNEALALVDSISRAVALTKTFTENLNLRERFQGLKNGVDIKWLTKYVSAAGTWVRKYLEF